MAAAEPRGFIRRINMARHGEEVWPPPLFSPARGPVQALAAWARRVLDLQAGSIWHDLKSVLPFVTGTIVDVGCGAQPYRSLVSAQARYVGIDTIRAKEHFGYEIPDTVYYEDDIWPIGDGTADLVLCTEVLEHVLDPARLLDEAFRCLAPGGTLLLTVPFAARWHFIPYDYYRYTPSGLDHLLTEAGFRNTRVYARGNAVTVACYKNMALILRLLIPGTANPALRLAMQLLSLPFLPVLILLAAIANISLHGGGGDDCLGYTVLAERGPS